MKVLIEIDEKTFKDLHEFVVINTGRSNGKTIIYKCLKAISNGTPIPNNAANLEVLKAIFPNKNFIKGRFDGWFEGDIRCKLDWLNAPYKGGE